MRAKSTPEIAEQAETVPSLRPFRLAENELTDKIIRAAIEVHRHLGPGLLESAYEECLCYEFSQMSLPFERQVHLPVVYKGVRLDCGYRMDLVVADLVVVEIKTVDAFSPIHSARLLTYLKLSGKPIGLLLNFNVPVLKEGLKRMVNRYARPLSPPISATSALDPGEEGRPGSSRVDPSSACSALNADEGAKLFSLSSSPRLRVSAVKKELS
jgi:GxxExxY protein